MRWGRFRNRKKSEKDENIRVGRYVGRVLRDGTKGSFYGTVGSFSNLILAKIEKIYGWGNTLGHFRNLKKSEKAEKIRVGAFRWVNTVGFAG